MWASLAIQAATGQILTAARIMSRRDSQPCPMTMEESPQIFDDSAANTQHRQNGRVSNFLSSHFLTSCHPIDHLGAVKYSEERMLKIVGLKNGCADGQGGERNHSVVGAGW